MRHWAVAGVAALALSACSLPGTDGPPDVRPLQQAAVVAADEAIPAAAAVLGGQLEYAYGVMVTCNLDAGTGAFAVRALYSAPTGYTDSDDADALLLRALEPLGFGPGKGPATEVLTNGTEHARVSPTRAAAEGERSYLLTVHSECVDMSQSQYRELVREVGATAVDTSAW